MNTVNGNPYVCELGHGSLLPYHADGITGWCDECHAVRRLTRQAPQAILSPQQSSDISNAIQERFRQYAATWDAARLGMPVLLNPDPKTDLEREVTAKLTAAKFPARHIATVPHMDQEGRANAQSISHVLSQSGPRAVVLWGEYGTGKTQLATAVASLRACAKKHTRYVDARDLTRAIRDNFDTKVPEAVILQRFNECPGLVIDEIQAALDEQPSRQSWARTLLQGIIDKRYTSAHPLKTILVCNAANPDELALRLGGHIVSRVQEIGRIIQVQRRNYRRAIAEDARRTA